MFKKILVTVVLGIIVTITSSQVPQKISYQAVVRNTDGTVVSSTQVKLRVSFLDGVSSTSYYSEEHTALTSSQGLVVLALGSGTPQSGSFAAIDWTTGDIKLRIEFEKSGSWIDMGSTSLTSVPYALYAGVGNQGEPGVGIENISLNPDSTLSIYLTNSTSYTTPLKIIGSKGDKGDQGIQGNPGMSGEPGVGIESVVLNPDSTLKIFFTNSTSYTTPIKIVGRKGDKGEQGVQGTQGLTGQTGNGIASIISNLDGTLTINYTSGESVTTVPLFGPKGDTGENGISINWRGSYTDPPETHNLNDAYHNTTLGISYVWDGDSWEIISRNGDIGPKGDTGPKGDQGLTGNQGPQGPMGPQGPAGVGLTLKGSWSMDSLYYPGFYVFDESYDDPLVNSMWICQDTIGPSKFRPKEEEPGYWIEFEAPAGESGISIEWLGELYESPSSPKVNQAYYNISDKRSYVWNGSVWSIITKDGEQGPVGPLVPGSTGETLVNNEGAWVATNKFYNDLANMRWGFLTKTPTATLDVNGTARFRSAIYDSQNLAGTAGQVLTRDAIGASWQNPILVGSGATGKMAIWNGTSSITQLPNLSFTNSLEVVGNETTNPDDPIFEVKNSAGEVIFGVYQEGVRINIKDAVLTKGAKGGFAVGGLSTQGKASNLEYFRITPDSARLYVNEYASSKGAKGGFAVGGLSTQGKAVEVRNLLFVAPDSARVYVDDSETKGAKGGFAVGGLSTQGKSISNKFLKLNPSNYFIGHLSGEDLTTGLYNSTLGYMAGSSITSGSYNAFIGYNSGLANTSGSSNVFIGYECGKTNTTGYSNVVIGKSSAISSNGNNNIVIGEYAGYSLTSGIHNTLIGSSAGYSHTNQDYNVMIGTSAGYHINSSGWAGSFNTFMGINAGYKIATSRDNTFIGTNAGYWIENGERNTFIGIDAGRSGAEHNNGYIANDNTVLGCKAGYNIRNGSTNIFLGTESGYSNQSGTGNVFIGYRAGYSEAGSNKLYISNTNVNPPLIFGDFALSRIGLGTVNPLYKLDVAGDINISSGSNYKINGVNISASTFGAEPTLTKGTLSALGPISLSANRQVIGGDAVISISNASTSIEGAVQLSNSYTGTSQVLATTEKALSDGLSTKANGNEATLGKIFLNTSGVIATIYGGYFDLYYNASAHTITARNTHPSQWCHYWYHFQKHSTPPIYAASAFTSSMGNTLLITFDANSQGCEINIGEENGGGYCTVSLTYSNGKIFGHYVKY